MDQGGVGIWEGRCWVWGRAPLRVEGDGLRGHSTYGERPGQGELAVCSCFSRALPVGAWQAC